MARVCAILGKKTAFGGNKKHRRGASGGGGKWKFKSQNTKRTWKVNLRKVRIEVDGQVKRVTVSMKAYKKLRKLAEVEK